MAEVDLDLQRIMPRLGDVPGGNHAGPWRGLAEIGPLPTERRRAQYNFWPNGCSAVLVRRATLLDRARLRGSAHIYSGSSLTAKLVACPNHLEPSLSGGDQPIRWPIAALPSLVWPCHMIWRPGSGSCLRARQPPRWATSRTASPSRSGAGKPC